ncbi:Variant surface glycoprotein [Trypanosoma congolense IL3000]|uniref:Variant surface glycoprotein n=1 Tax=Trypanosoma congolense (strain IL3000) TaxID=1068625 RepID=F9W6U8_TRYCI|nr:Variant surface glycoprotein [Trypanosoma congolense IL3000]
MWRRVLLVLMVVWTGALAAEKTNEKVFKRLCNITSGVTALMKQSVETKGTLEEALYGGNGGAQFNVDGTFKGGCWWLGGFNHRSTYCSHIQGAHPGLGGTDNHGCFAHSLLGTLFCLCTKGSNRDEDLCGLGSVGNDSRWVSGLPRSDDLFQKVWKKINETCTENKSTADLENLQTAVKEIHGGAKENKVKNGYFTLGGNSTDGVCGGTRQGDACVTYPPKTGSGEQPDIPWAEKILTEIPILKKTIKQQISLQDSSQIDQQGNEGHSDEDPGEQQEGEEEEDEEQYVQNSTPHNPSNKPRTRRKRSTKKQPTEQHAESLKAILHKDDGSYLPQPFWLLSAVVI